MRDHKIAGVKPEETVVKPTAKEAKETVSALEEAYKKQNPEKYAAKKASGAFKVTALLAVIALAGILAVNFTVSAFNSNSAPKVVVEGDYIEASSDVPQLDENLGAGSGPVNPFNWYSNGGIRYMTVRGNMQTNTSTLCSFQNPFTTGTSTLETFDFQITTGTSTALTIVLATSTSAYNTTTADSLIATGASVAASGQESYSWNAGIGTVANAGEVPPNAYVLLMPLQDKEGGFWLTGACQAVFRKMPDSL